MPLTNDEALAACVRIEAMMGDDLRVRDGNLSDLATALYSGANKNEALLNAFCAAPPGIYIFDVWQYRHGQPWQAALEAPVEAYRREPRRFDQSRDLCDLMLAAIEAKGLVHEYYEALNLILHPSVSTKYPFYWALLRATPAEMVEAFARMQSSMEVGDGHNTGDESTLI